MGSPKSDGLESYEARKVKGCAPGQSGKEAVTTFLVERLDQNRVVFRARLLPV